MSTMGEYVYTGMVVMGAATLHASTGFAFSILAVPLLLLMLKPLVALQINLLLATALSAAMIPSVLGNVDWRFLGRLLGGALVGLPLGIALLRALDPGQIRLLVAGAALLFVGALLANRRIAAEGRREIWFGLAAGALTSAVGMGGIPLLMYSAGSDRPIAAVRATVTVFFLVTYGASLVSSWVALPVNGQAGTLALAMLPVLGLGLQLGKRAYSMFTQRSFRLVMLCILGGNSLFLLAHALR